MTLNEINDAIEHELSLHGFIHPEDYEMIHQGELVFLESQASAVGASMEINRHLRSKGSPERFSVLHKGQNYYLVYCNDQISAWREFMNQALFPDQRMDLIANYKLGVETEIMYGENPKDKESNSPFYKYLPSNQCR